MTTLEKTISIMKTLPERDLLEVQRHVEKLSRKRNNIDIDEAVGNFLKPMTSGDFLRDIEKAEQQFAEGKSRKAEQVFYDLEQRYKV